MELLWITCALAGVLAYLLLGVALQRGFETRALAPVLAKLRPSAAVLAVVDAHSTVVLLTRAGEAAFLHSQVLVGQRLADLLRRTDDKVALLQSIRLAAPGTVVACTIVGERGGEHALSLGVEPCTDMAARRAGLSQVFSSEGVARAAQTAETAQAI
jgi:hypothetical protein